MNDYFRGIEESIGFLSKSIADTRFYLDGVLFGNALNIYKQFKMAQHFDISGAKVVYEAMRKNFKGSNATTEEPIVPGIEEDI